MQKLLCRRHFSIQITVEQEQYKTCEKRIEKYPSMQEEILKIKKVYEQNIKKSQ